MSSASVTPAAPVSFLVSDWKWITTHIVLLVVVAALVVGSVYLVESIVAKHDASTASKYDQILSEQTQQTKTLQQQLTTDESNWATIQSQLLAQNSRLAQAVTQKNQQLAVQVKADANLDTQDAATKLAQQTQAAGGEVTSTASGVSLDLPIARRIVSSLDTLVVAQSDLSSTQTQLANETTVATNAQADATASKGVIAAQQAALTDAQKDCDTRVATANANGRKSGLKGFLAGAAAVLIAIAGHAI